MNFAIRVARSNSHHSFSFVAEISYSLMTVRSLFEIVMARAVILLILCSTLFSASVISQPSPQKFQQFVTRVNIASEPARTALVDSFMNSTTFPAIEDSTAIYIYRGTATSVVVTGDMTEWSSSGLTMTKLSTTNLWYKWDYYANDARLDYKFILNGSNWILDPLNPHRVAGGYGPNSELALPGYVQPWEILPNASIPHGRSVVHSIYSALRGATYSVRVYLPPGYDASAERFPSVYFQDGSDYVGLGSAMTVLDNLIDSQKVRPVIGVFVTPTNRNGEYAGSTRTAYRLFFVNELVPFIDSAYRTFTTPESRVVLGDSYGGNISALISWYHPDVFGNCGLHSGAFQENGYEAYHLLINGPPKPDSLRFVSVWGTYEGSLTGTMRTLKDSLIAQGYDVRWQLRHEGHSWGLWRATIDFMLEYFLPPITDVRETAPLPGAFVLEQNYPNPCNPSTAIGYRLAVRSKVTITVSDLLGRTVATLVDGVEEPGTNVVRWDASGNASGVYVYRLQATAEGAAPVVLTRKLVFVK